MTTILKELQIKLQDPRIDYQTIIIGVSLVVAAFEGWIGSRQKPYLLPSLHPTLPASLEPYLPSSTRQETYKKSQAYALAKHQYSTIVTKLDLVQSYLLLSCILGPLFGLLFPRLSSPPTSSEIHAPFFGTGHGSWTLLRGVWDLAARFPGVKGEISTSMAFVAILTVVGTILSLPQDYYKNFVLEEKHGFNKMTRSTFLADAVKGLVLSLVLELPLIAGIIRIIHWVGTDGILRIVAWIMVFIFTIQLIMIPLYPYVIAPLFNTFTPLDEKHEVYPKVKDLATKLNFPLGRVWVMDGSKRSAHSNAFFFGLPFLTKHIVIYDTLLEKSTPSEVEAILAHELGHWAGHHVLILLLTSLVQTAFSLLTFSLFLSNPTLLDSFGFTRSTLYAGPKGGPTIVSLFLAASLFAPMSAVLQFTTNTVTRALEYQADRFAYHLGPDYAKNLKGALVSIHEKNLSVYGVDPVYSAYNHNHPTLYVLGHFGYAGSQLTIIEASTSHRIERLESLDSALEEGKNESDKKAKKDL